MFHLKERNWEKRKLRKLINEFGLTLIYIHSLGVQILSSSYNLQFPSFLHGFVTRGIEKINGWSLRNLKNLIEACCREMQR
jgi:hypothetical protein